MELFLNEPMTKTTSTAWISGAIIALALGMLPDWAPQWTTCWLCRPSGWLASVLMGIGHSVDNGQFQLLHPAGVVAVSLDCSGAGFLGMTAGLGYWLTGQLPGRWRHVLWGIPAIYLFTLVINSIRISASTSLAAFAATFVPDVWQPHLHLWAGIATFLPALIGLYLLIERHTQKEPRS